MKPTPCNPREQRQPCATCLRYRPDLPQLAETRPRTVCIDATVLRWPDGVCPMFVAQKRACKTAAKRTQ